MGYGRGGRRGYGSRPSTVGRVSKPNRRPGACRICQEEIPAGAGQLYREASGDWSVVHVPMEWTGSPVSGQYTGGCPGETDRINTDGKFGGQDGARSERERIASAAAMFASANPEPARRASYARTSSGARMYERCGHEDFPCCGCGD